MVRRRRNARSSQTRKKGSQKRTVSKKTNKSLKERLLTTGIWGLSLINVALIFSLLSNFFSSPNEAPVSAGLSPGVADEPIENPITVEVLNACGVQGLANEVTQFLRSKNFDVVNIDNYRGGYNLDRTLVFDRVSLDSKNAARVASALGVSQKQIIPELEDSLQLKVTVLIGKDYKKLRMFADSH